MVSANESAIPPTSRYPSRRPRASPRASRRPTAPPPSRAAGASRRPASGSGAARPCISAHGPTRAACSPAPVTPRRAVISPDSRVWNRLRVIVEILNEDGTMARRPDLEAFAQHPRAEDRHHCRPHSVPRYATRRPWTGSMNATLPTAVRALSPGRLPGLHRQRGAPRPGHGRGQRGAAGPGAGAQSRTPSAIFSTSAGRTAGGPWTTPCDRSASAGQWCSGRAAQPGHGPGDRAERIRDLSGS